MTLNNTIVANQVGAELENRNRDRFDEPREMRLAVAGRLGDDVEPVFLFEREQALVEV